MFNSSHTLVGLALSRTGLDRWSRHATWTAVIATNLPDIDIVTSLYDTPAYIEYHRGITHTFISIPVLSLALAAAMYKFSGNFWRTFGVSSLAISTHLLLDYLNTYGVRPFLPFDGTWFYGDALFVIDPYFDLVLLASIVSGRFIAQRRRQLALIGLAIVTLYIGGLMELRNLSRSYLTGPERAGVMPRILNPFVWIGLIDSPSDVSAVVIDPFRGVIGGPDKMTKAPVSEIIIRASESRAAIAFLGFARFPVITVSPLESGYSVTFLDVRFYSSATNTGFAAKVLLDSSLRVIEDSLSFTQAIN